MMATPHLLAGAAIGKVARPPWLALALAFVSHFLLDIVPHLDAHGLYGTSLGRPTRPEVGFTVVDVAFGAALVILLARRQPGRQLMLWGAFCAMLPDLVFNVPPWGRRFSNWGGTAWLAHLHHGFSHGINPSDWPVGVGMLVVAVATQALVAAFALWVI